MNPQAMEYYGRKFFPYLLPQYQALAIIAICEALEREDRETPRIAEMRLHLKARQNRKETTP